MRRRVLCAALAILSAVGLAVAWTVSRSGAQPDAAKSDGKSVTLPLTQVILFNSGIGYLQREGEVAGDARVELTFPVGDVNDLLKSLILEDAGGGKVAIISYDSQDPLDKTLRSFALDLNANPTYGQILNQARGEKIDVMRQEKPGANPFKVSGIIVGMESHEQQLKDTTVEVEQLNLLTNDGMVGIPLTQVLSVRFQNPTLETEFRRALQVLAGAHDVQKKMVSLQFTGKAKRTVKVGYVVERPIWKTTYRLVLEPNGKVFMQGWAIVENTSDDDWNNVRMVLVSGKPISYRMDLYEPLYVPRPVVEPEVFASLRPPLYGGSIGGDAKNKWGWGIGGGFGGGIGGFPGYPDAPAKKQPGGGMQDIQEQIVDLKGKDKEKSNKYQVNPVLPDAAQKLDFAEYQQRLMKLQENVEKAKKAGATIAGLNYKEGVQSIASAEDVGEYYQYLIDQKITLARQKSAMLPILNQTIEGNKVSIYNESVHAKYPLLGIRLKNTSGKPLTQGPITVYDDGAYAGDTRTLDLQPNEERLFSYALDQGTEVKSEVQTNPAPEMTLNIGGDNLTAVYTLRQTRTYIVKNRSTHDRTLVIEHPIREDWKLVDPAKPADKSRDVYRFEVKVKAGDTVTQLVVEEQTRTDPVALSGGKDIPPSYAVVTGIEVKPLVKASAEELQSLAVAKGVLQATSKQRESKTYFVQNNSDHDHAFTIDHVIRKEWKRLGKDGKDQAGPDVYRFKVAVKSKATAQHEVVEERVYQDKTRVVAKLDEEVLRGFVMHPATPAKVKEALQKVLDLQAALRAAKLELAEKKDALKVLTEDQARVRENLQIIPPSSEHYKDFLKKFVAQEAQIEELQKKIRSAEATAQKLSKEYEAYVTALTVQ
jgi:hypothetical protein